MHPSLVVSVLLLLSAAGTVEAAPAPPAPANPRPALRLVEEQPDPGGSTYVYELTRADGSRRRFASSDPALPHALSPDGKWLALPHKPRDWASPGLVLYAVATDAYEVRERLDAAAIDGSSELRWSPDSRSVAYVVVAQGRGWRSAARLFVHDVARRRTSAFDVQGFAGCGGGCPAPTPVFSPDGRRLAVLEQNYAEANQDRDPPVPLRTWVGLYARTGKRVAKIAVGAGLELRGWSRRGLILADSKGTETVVKVR